jgi:hypothetical protein
MTARSGSCPFQAAAAAQHLAIEQRESAPELSGARGEVGV